MIQRALVALLETWVQIQTPTWQLETTCNPSSRKLHSCSGLHGLTHLPGIHSTDTQIKNKYFSKTICFTPSFTVKPTQPMLDCLKLLWVVWFFWKRDLPSALALPEVPRSGLALQHSSALMSAVSSRSLQNFFYNSFFFSLTTTHSLLPL